MESVAKGITFILKDKLRCSQQELLEELTNDSYSEPVSVADWIKRFEVQNSGVCQQIHGGGENTEELTFRCCATVGTQQPADCSRN